MSGPNAEVDVTNVSARIWFRSAATDMGRQGKG